jgi:transposase
MNDTIGVDISKASLEVWRLSDRRHMRFSNDTDGLKALCRWLGADPVRVIYEATGRFRRDLEAALSKAGHGPVKVNPSRARRYAQATGNIAKTDRVDARMLAHMGATLALEPTPVCSKSMHEIRELHVARVALIKDCTACRNRLDTARSRMVVAQLKARERQIDRQIAQIDAALVLAPERAPSSAGPRVRPRPRRRRDRRRRRCRRRSR